MMKKLLSVILAAVLFATLSISAAAAENSYGINYPTKAEIFAKAKELGIDFSTAETFSEPYNTDGPDYAPGKMSEQSQQQALDVLNFYRYIAGLPSDVQIDDSFGELAQASALVNAANGTLSHYPEKPADMSDELYQLGYSGSGRANIAWNQKNLKYAIVKGWMDDSSASNIPMVGHRRWILNPSMQYTGFGEAQRYYAMYSFDRSRKGSFTGDYIAWPAPNTPLEMFSGSVFSVTLGSGYDKPSADKVSVTVTSETLQKSWTVNKENPERGFYVNNDGYGMAKCIIFKVDNFSAEDTIHITISGVTKNGTEAPIDYTVNLFSMADISTTRRYVILRPQRTMVDPEVTATSLLDSQPAVSWSSTDGDIADYYPGYGLFSYQEGEATVTASVGGKSVDIPVISSLSPVLLGDADRDGEIASIDTTLIQRVMAFMDVSYFCEITSDVDGDGEITITDTPQIQRWLATMDTKYPIGESM